MPALACMPLSERQFNWVMRSVDPDQSGDLSRYELTLLLLGSERSLHEKKKRHQNQLRSQAAAALARQAALSEGMTVDEKIADYRRIFQQADTDRSGEISWSELQVVLERVTGTEHSETDVKEMIHAIDEDGSGDIDFGEFLLLMGESLHDKELAIAAVNESSKRNRALWQKAHEHAKGEVRRSKADLTVNAGGAIDVEAGGEKGTDAEEGVPDAGGAADPTDVLVESGQEPGTVPAREVNESTPAGP